MAKKKNKKSPRKGTSQKRPIIRLSQCMIVKNEEANIRQALSWGKEIVCEQIVVDTGSSDRTAELARGMGAKVFSYPWKGDFSAAKNYAIEQAKGNWIAFLDADEWMVPEETKKLMQLLSGIHHQRQVDTVRTKIAHLEEDGSVINVSSQDRFFRKIPELRYRNRIHEELCREDGKVLLQYWDAQELLTILHSGYAGVERRKGKGRRNRQLLEAEIQQNPHDAMCWTYLGDACKSTGDNKRAESCYRRVLEDPEMEMNHESAPLRAALELMALLVDRSAEELHEDYEKIHQRLKEAGKDSHPDIDYYLGWMYLKEGNLESAALHYERTLQKIENYRGAETVRATAELEMLNRIIATTALLQGNPQKSVTFAVEALKVNKYSTDGLGILLRAFQTEWQEGMSAEPYWQFLGRLYDMQSLKDLLFVYKLSGEAGFAALQQEIWGHMPMQVRQELQA